MSNGQAIVPAIVIDVTHEDWPSGRQRFRPLDPGPRRAWPDDTMCFRTRLDPGNNEVRFQISAAAIH